MHSAALLHLRSEEIFMLVGLYIHIYILSLSAHASSQCSRFMPRGRESQYDIAPYCLLHSIIVDNMSDSDKNKEVPVKKLHITLLQEEVTILVKEDENI